MDSTVTAARITLRDAPRATQPSNPALQRLATHMDIAWDVDNTLIDHPASPLLHRFILATPHIRHVIVTFRNERQGGPWHALARYAAAPGPTAFSRVIYLPEVLREQYSQAQAARRNSLWPAFDRLLRPRKSGWESTYRAWKGMMCEREGITALVDDMTQMVAVGCQRHGVKLFHPSDFLTSKRTSLAA